MYMNKKQLHIDSNKSRLTRCDIPGLLWSFPSPFSVMYMNKKQLHIDSNKSRLTRCDMIIPGLL